MIKLKVRKSIALQLCLLMVFAIAANMAIARESNDNKSVMREEFGLTETAVESLSIVEELTIDGQRLLLEDSINYAMELKADTHVSVTGAEVPSNRFWASQAEHTKLLNAIATAQRFHDETNGHLPDRLTINMVNISGNPVREATVELIVNNVSSVHHINTGTISFQNISAGNNVRIRANPAINSDHLFLRFEVAEGNIEISPFVNFPQFIMPYGSLVLRAVFETTVEDTTEGEPVEWDERFIMYTGLGLYPEELDIDGEAVVMNVSEEEQYLYVVTVTTGASLDMSASLFVNAPAEKPLNLIEISGNEPYTLEYNPPERHLIMSPYFENNASDSFTAMSATRVISPPNAAFGNIQIRSNVTWRVRSSNDWIDLPTGSVTGNGWFWVSTTPHIGTTARNGTIEVFSPGVASLFIQVTQQPGNGLALWGDNGTATASASFADVYLDSNRTWTVESSHPNWLIPGVTGGNGNGAFRIFIRQNTGISPRGGAITVRAGATVRHIVISQTGATATLSLSGTVWRPTANASTGTVNVTSNAQ